MFDLPAANPALPVARTLPWHRIAFVIAPAVVIAAALLPPPAAHAGTGFDRPALIALAPSAAQADLRAASRHILVVRHARKIAEDCNALDCELSARGDAMVARLAALIGEPPVDIARASGACRAALTAAAGGAPVIQHQAGNGIAQGCGVDEPLTLTRDGAMQAARAGGERWTLVAEHSNTACPWVAEFAGVEAAAEAGCEDGRLPETAYGDIFWLYRIGREWRLAALPAAFDLPETD